MSSQQEAIETQLIMYKNYCLDLIGLLQDVGMPYEDIIESCNITVDITEMSKHMRKASLYCEAMDNSPTTTVGGSFRCELCSAKIDASICQNGACTIFINKWNICDKDVCKNCYYEKVCEDHQTQ